MTWNISESISGAIVRPKSGPGPLERAAHQVDTKMSVGRGTNALRIISIAEDFMNAGYLSPRMSRYPRPCSALTWCRCQWQH